MEIGVFPTGVRLSERRWLCLALVGAGSIAILSACSGGSGNVTPAAPQTGSAMAPSAAARPAATRSSRQVTTITTPADTQVLSVGADGSVYFGSVGTIVPGFCLYVQPVSSGSCSSIAPGLYRYNGGTFTFTNPHGPYFGHSASGITCDGLPIPDKYCSWGNVAAIDAADFPSVVWSSDYAEDFSFIPFGKLQWGGDGGKATSPPHPYNHNLKPVGEIVSIVRAGNGSIWLGGGGVQPNVSPAKLPATCRSTGTSPCDMLFLANGPGKNVWAMTRTYPQYSQTPNGSAFFEFSPSGSLLKTYTTSDVGIRMTATANAVWFTDFTNDAIGTIDAAGKVSEYKIPTPNAGPYGIAAASDGSIWFTEFNASKVGRLDKHGHFMEIALSFQPFSIATTPSGCSTAEVWVGSLGTQLAEVTP
ncbi:MAG TPA: hypothetical protein VMF61_03340 [Candidatus Acidoferrales bacterium]|nr:hypothetical protein [Candidatus Acidoferrales bacterium]